MHTAPSRKEQPLTGIDSVSFPIYFFSINGIGVGRGRVGKVMRQIERGNGGKVGILNRS